MKKWKKLKSELILDTKFFKVRKDIVELPDGAQKEWTYWDSNDSAMVVGMTEDKKIVMIKQYRYLVDYEVVEFPSGGAEEGEKIEDAARREFEEESGYRCKELIKLCSVYETYGQLNRQIHIFFAPNIEKTKQNTEDDEYIDVELMEFNEVVKLALENKIDGMGSILEILLLKEKLERGEIKDLKK